MIFDGHNPISIVYKSRGCLHTKPFHDNYHLALGPAIKLAVVTVRPSVCPSGIPLNHSKLLTFGAWKSLEKLFKFT